MSTFHDALDRFERFLTHVRPLLMAALCVCGLANTAAAQRRPTPEEAQRLLQTRPDLILQLKQRLQSSGLSDDQIRERLKAEGYPETLLDAYLKSGSGSEQIPDSLANAEVFRAMRALGIVDSTDLAKLTDAYGRRRRGTPLNQLTPDSLQDSTARRDTTALPDTLKAPKTRVFGLDLFRKNTSQFDPNLAGPVDANYRIGPGDELVLILTGDVETAYTLDVTREGFVVIPQVGRLPVANLTLGQLNDMLYDRLRRVYSGVRRGAGATTQFSLSVAKLHANQVFVVGDVTTPGSYRVSSAGTALTALYAAGGPTERGSLRRIEVRRAGRAVDTLDLYDYLLRGDASSDPRLESGDVLFVPVMGARVKIDGEIVRPAIYEMRPRETLANLITMAGGFTEMASRQRVQIERIAPPSDRTGNGDRLVIDVTSQLLASGTAPAVALEPGDVVHVFTINDRVRTRVTVHGNVWNPGIVGFRDGLKVSDALKLAGGLKPDTYLGSVLVTRLKPDSQRTQLRTILRDTTGGVVDDFVLRPDDEIRVFSVTEFRPDLYVAISGAVRRSGRYRYREGMTVRDLVLLAGGLEQRAYTREVEIARIPANRTEGQTAINVRVPLDSTYLIADAERGRSTSTAPTLASGAPEPRLQPYDNVLVFEQPDYQLLPLVKVTGEVRFPGTYALRSKSERLSDIIARAGGLTASGYADGIQFFRMRDSLGRIGIDLPRVLKNAKYRDNLLLEDRDSLNVPRYQPVVTVTGAVNAPVSVAYAPGRDIDYYVARAGGPQRRADAKRAYVTQPNGSVESRRSAGFFFALKPKPAPGAVVIVPARDSLDRRDYTAMVGSVAQVLASLVAIIVIAKR